MIAVASFALFVVNETSSASTHQQRELNGDPTAPVAKPGTAAPPAAKHSQESTLRQTVDDVSETLTSPFSGVTAGSSSQWVIRGVNVLLALIVYGFGLGFLARVIRIRL